MEFKKSIWQIGKEDNRKFLQIKLTRKHNLASFMIGILVAAIIMLPFACLVFECIVIVWYNRRAKYAFLAIAWGLILLCNGIANYSTIRAAKSWNSDMIDLQRIDEKAVFFYQTFNPGFAFFIFMIMMFFAVMS